MFGKRDRYTGGTCARTCTLICTRVRAHVPYALRSCSVKRELEERPDRINSDIASNTSVQCELCGVPCHVLCDRVRFGVRFGSASCSASSRTQTQPVLEARVRVMIARQLTLAGNTAYPVRCRGSAQLSSASGRARVPPPPDEAACRARGLSRESASADCRAASYSCAPRAYPVLFIVRALSHNGSGRHSSARLTPSIGSALCARC